MFFSILTWMQYSCNRFFMSSPEPFDFKKLLDFTSFFKEPVRLGNRTIGVNFRKNNRRDPQSGRFGFLTEPDTTRKP